ncbi:MAG: hypothetical protein JSS32_04285 [Verrucomicrobia bacterium]|nr:hypothetical protein [Verrucomicrobiota bacterium]
MANPAGYPLLSVTNSHIYPEAIHEFGGDDRALYPNHPEYMDGNTAARMKIVEGLGGEVAVRAIPIVGYPEVGMSPVVYWDKQGVEIDTGKRIPRPDSYMKELNTLKFPEGSAVVQLEDPHGRKAVCVRVQDRTTQEVQIVRIFQRYRETSTVVLKGPNDEQWVIPNGRTWVCSGNGMDSAAPGTGTEEISKELGLLMNDQHQRLVLIKA